MHYGKNWQEDLWREYDRLMRTYAELQSAYEKGERLCDKPEKPTQPLVYGKDSVSEFYEKCFAEFAKTKEARKRAFLKFKPDVS